MMPPMPVRENIPVRSLLLLTAVVAAVMAVFLLWGERLEVWTDQTMTHSAAHPWQIALLVIVLLGIDVAVPIPSSVVCTAAGIFLGIPSGTLAAWLGLMLTVAASYLIGRYATRPAEAVIGPREFALLQRFHAKHGLWLLVAMRPVPMFAETSVLFAGIARLPPLPVMVATGLANLIVAGMYVILGAWGRQADAFLPAFGLSLLLSAIFMAVARWRTTSTTTRIAKGNPP